VGRDESGEGGKEREREKKLLLSYSHLTLSETLRGNEALFCVCVQGGTQLETEPFKGFKL